MIVAEKSTLSLFPTTTLISENVGDNTSSQSQFLHSPCGNADVYIEFNTEIMAEQHPHLTVNV